MSWDRHYSQLEKLLVEILEESDSALTLQEIVKKIESKEPGIFTGKTPSGSQLEAGYIEFFDSKKAGYSKTSGGNGSSAKIK